MTGITLSINFPYLEALLKQSHILLFDLNSFRSQRACTNIHIKVFIFSTTTRQKKPRTIHIIRKRKNIICSVCHAQLSSGKIGNAASNDLLNKFSGMIYCNSNTISYQKKHGKVQNIDRVRQWTGSCQSKASEKECAAQ